MLKQVDICIEGGTIITVDSERRVIRDGLVVLDKGVIADLGKSVELKNKYKGKKVIDGAGKLIMPGLINAHIHFCTHLHKGFLPESLSGAEWTGHAFAIKELVSAEEELWAARATLIETLKTGTTCFAEAGALFPESTIEGIEDLGMRGRVGRWCSDQMAEVRRSTTGIQVNYKRQEENTEGIIRANEELLKKYQGGLGNGRIKLWVTILGSRYCSEELLRESKKMADKYNTMFYMHQSPYIDPVHRAREKVGKRPIAWLEDLQVLGQNVLLVHMVAIDDTEIRILKEHDVKVVHCPTTALKLAYGLYAFGRFPEMMNAGVSVALGSDSSECSNHHDMIRILNLSAMVFKDMRYDAFAMTAERAIEMATINGAKAMGLEKEIGSLEKGKKADLIILDMRRPEWVPLHNEIQNLVYSATGDSVETVIIDGKIVVENRTVQTIDESEVLAKVQELGEKLVKRTGRSITTSWKIV